jgi:anaerobic magnesium-protoporphyrin IX monomethyl ester cyclase
MTEVVLVYPYFDPPNNNSEFRFPPLGLGYIAAYLRDRGIDGDIVDCTFITEEEALKSVRERDPRIIGFYSMFSMKDETLKLGRELKEDCELLVVGGPLPSTQPEIYLQDFDVIAIGEGEETMLDIVTKGDDALSNIRGIVYKTEKDGGKGEVVRTRDREFIPDLNSIPSPARDLFDNESYIAYYRERDRVPTTSMMSSRGCPFQCDFCSRPVFGNNFRERSPDNILDEIEEILSLGYERVFFQDDCFTLTKRRIQLFCDHLEKRGMELEWECLSRVDTLDEFTAEKMKATGCRRIFFGLESGSNEVLKIMNKDASVEEGRRAVEAARSAGIETGAFFILGYPGETDDTLIQTLNFSSALPLNYLSYSFPYPIPGTGLYKRVHGEIYPGNPEPKHEGRIPHQLIYSSEFSDRKLKFAIFKGMVQFHLRKHLGMAAPLIEKPFKYVTDNILRIMN